MTLLRAPQDTEILVAIIAGQVIGSLPANADHDAPATIESAVDTAEDIVREVYRRSDGA